MLAGVALELPGPARFRDNVLKAVKKGQITESQIDSLAKDVITLALKVGGEGHSRPEMALPRTTIVLHLCGRLQMGELCF